MPHILRFSSSLKYLANSISCFSDAKTTTTWRKLAAWWSGACSHQPSGAYGLVTINQSENYAQVDHVPWDTRLSPCWNPSGSFGFLSKTICSPCLKVKVAQSCPTLCSPMDCSLPSSSVHGILQAKILEWVAIPFSRASSHGPAVNLSLLPNFMNLPSVTRLQESSWVKTWARWVSNPCSCFGEDHFRWRKFKDGNKPGNFIGREASGAEAEWGEE